MVLACSYDDGGDKDGIGVDGCNCSGVKMMLMIRMM